MARGPSSTQPHEADADLAITAELKSRGLRSTSARRLIITTLRATSAHPTVDEMRVALESRGHQIGVATLYQNLSRLADAGIIARFLDSEGLLRFDENLDHHHHLLCISCGRIADVGLEGAGARRLDKVADEIADEHESWDLDDSQLELRGLCPECRAAR